MNCTHKKTISYDLKPADTFDFNTRLEEKEVSKEFGSHGRAFHTPHIQRNKARSMLATTKSSQPTTETKFFESELRENLTASFEKRRSSAGGREKRSIAPPTTMANCEECGAICFNVSCQARPSMQPRLFEF